MFGRKKSENSGNGVTHDKALDYVIELSDEEYEKFIKLARVYRDANKKAADIIASSATADAVKEPAQPTSDDDLLEDELTSAFIEAPKKIEVQG